VYCCAPQGQQADDSGVYALLAEGKERRSERLQAGFTVYLSVFIRIKNKYLNYKIFGKITLNQNYTCLSCFKKLYFIL
jgi:hypothetical protein